MLDMFVKNPAMMELLLEKVRPVLDDPKSELPEYIRKPAKELFLGFDRWKKEKADAKKVS